MTFTAAAPVSFLRGVSGSFSVTTTFSGVAPVLSETGVLPSGVAFVDNHDGTGTFSGTPADTAARKLDKVKFTAANTAGKATQRFALALDAPPALTSKPPSTFVVG